MPRRSILSDNERENLLNIPETKEELIRHYSLNSDRSLEQELFSRRKAP